MIICSTFPSFVTFYCIGRLVDEVYRHLSIDFEDEKNPPVEGQDGTEKSLKWSIQKGLNQFFAPNESFKTSPACVQCNKKESWTRRMEILS